MGDARGHIDLSRATLQRDTERPLCISVSVPGRKYPMAADRPGALAMYTRRDIAAAA